MRDEPKYNVVRALLADGVSEAEVYQVLRTPEGVDRAFAKLDTIKPVLQFWSAGAQPPTRLLAGDLVMSVAYNGRITSANREGHDNLKIIWDHTVAYLDQWVILADSPHKDLAYKFLAYYGEDAGRQIAYARDWFPYGPVLKEAADQISPELAAELPMGEHMATAFITGTPDDLDFWLDNLDEITERWNAWKVAE